MIKTTYGTINKKGNRYVRKSVGEDQHGRQCYKWCIQNPDKPRYDVAQGTCDADDLPDHIRKQCDTHTGMFYACLWPFESE